MKTLHTIAGCLLGLLAITAGCKKTDRTNGVLNVEVNHTVDGAPLIWDSLLYTNQAGNVYSVERLQYYLSDFRFYANKVFIAQKDTVLYVDARKGEANHFMLDKVPLAYFDSVSFMIGVSPQKNITNGLPATMENTIMAWPEMMGGGYHFMKLEGRWKDGQQTPGFAMHIGTQGLQVQAGMPCDVAVTTGGTKLQLTMNINEWFRNPHTFNFANDGVYIMGNVPLMRKIQENGWDVFR